jgi:hypothetical protein
MVGGKQSVGCLAGALGGPESWCWCVCVPTLCVCLSAAQVPDGTEAGACPDRVICKAGTGIVGPRVVSLLGVVVGCPASWVAVCATL